MKFKKGDIVRCIDTSALSGNELINNVIYIIKHIDKSYSSDYIELTNYNFSYRAYNGFFPRRFKKISSADMSKKEKFEYIKYKLGVRDECQKKKQIY